VWYGTLLGLFVCLCTGAAVIGVFYKLGKNKWAAASKIWEGAFAMFASVIITIMGAALLRVSKLQDKWRVKLAKSLEKRDGMARQVQVTHRLKLWAEKYAMFSLPFITVLREGMEAVVFIGGVSLSFPVESFPIPVVVALVCGSLVGWLIYRSVCQTNETNCDTDGYQRRKFRFNSDLPHCINLLPVPSCRGPLLQSCLAV